MTDPAPHKRPGLPRQDDNPQAAGLLQLINYLDNPVEHGGIKGVHLVGPDETDIGNAAFQHGD